MRLDPFGQPDTFDPTATWQRLHASGQLVGYDPELDMWLIAGHDNVRTVLADTHHFSNSATLAPIRPVSQPARQILAGLNAPPVTVTADPPDHLRTRAILRALFPTTAIRVQERWGDLVQARTEGLVDELADRPVADLMHFAVYLPLQVILDILGLPTANAAELRAWTDDFNLLVWGNPEPATQLACAHAGLALWRFCENAVTDRAEAAEPGTGLIGDLLRYRNHRDSTLTLAEIAALTLNIFGAGWETTAGALGHALHHGLAEPDRWKKLGHDEHYLALHVEETLRHSPAIDGWLRKTVTEVTIDGVTIPAGARCLLLIGAANHDPAVYTAPGRFDPHRPRSGQHLAFGYGPHRCVGAALARLEMTTALRTLARRLPNLVLADDYQRRLRSSVALRQHTDLPAHPSGRCPVAHDTRP